MMEISNLGDVWRELPGIFILLVNTTFYFWLSIYFIDIDISKKELLYAVLMLKM